MSKQYFELTTDYETAMAILKDGRVVVGKCGQYLVSTHLFSYKDGQLFADGQFQTEIIDFDDFVKHCTDSFTRFILPIPDPTYELKTDLSEVQQQCSKLQHSLTQALNEADELRDENTHQKELLEELRIAVNSDNKAETIRLLQIQIKNYQAMLEGVNESCDQTLTSIAKQLGFDHFDKEQVGLAIEELQTLKQQNKTIESRSISSNTILIEKIRDLNNQIQALEDNLTRSQSDHLSELTTIIRMIQALSDTPQECYYGAIRLIYQVIYDQICKLDPTQSLDI